MVYPITEARLKRGIRGIKRLLPFIRKSIFLPKIKLELQFLRSIYIKIDICIKF